MPQNAALPFFNQNRVFHKFGVMAQCLVFANASTLVANLQSLHLQRIFANHVK